MTELENNITSHAQLKTSTLLFQDFGVKMFGTLLRLFSKAAQLAERSSDDSLFLNLVGVRLSGIEAVLASGWLSLLACSDCLIVLC